MDYTIAYEQYSPKKFEQELKGLQQLSSEQRRKLLVDTFLNPTSVFLSPVLADGKHLKMLQTQDGKPILPVFTSRQMAMKDPTFDVNCKMFAGNISFYGRLMDNEPNVIGLVLNYSPDAPGVVISRESLLQMRNAYVTRMEALQKNSDSSRAYTLTYRSPGSNVLELALAAAEPVFKEYGIQKAWLYRAASNTENVSEIKQFVYVVEGNETEQTVPAEIKEKLTAASSSLIAEGETIEVLSSDSTVGKKLSLNKAPFYSI